MDHSPPGSSVHGILQQEYWSWLPCPPPGELPNPAIETASLMSLAGGFFTPSATWETPTYYYSLQKCSSFLQLQRKHVQSISASINVIESVILNVDKYMS